MGYTFSSAANDRTIPTTSHARRSMHSAARETQSRTGAFIVATLKRKDGRIGKDQQRPDAQARGESLPAAQHAHPPRRQPAHQPQHAQGPDAHGLPRGKESNPGKRQRHQRWIGVGIFASLHALAGVKSSCSTRSIPTLWLVGMWKFRLSRKMCKRSDRYISAGRARFNPHARTSTTRMRSPGECPDVPRHWMWGWLGRSLRGFLPRLPQEGNNPRRTVSTWARTGGRHQISLTKLAGAVIVDRSRCWQIPRWFQPQPAH